jgi:hypothetical protein
MFDLDNWKSKFSSPLPFHLHFSLSSLPISPKASPCPLPIHNLFPLISLPSLIVLSLLQSAKSSAPTPLRMSPIKPSTRMRTATFFSTDLGAPSIRWTPSASAMCVFLVFLFRSPADPPPSFQWTRFANHVCSNFNVYPKHVYIDDGDVSRPIITYIASRDIEVRFLLFRSFFLSSFLPTPCFPPVFSFLRKIDHPSSAARRGTLRLILR